MAIKGCYLEVINRAFDKINVTCENVKDGDWENKKSPADYFNNLEIKKYGSKSVDVEMDGVISYDGKFNISISLFSENNIVGVFSKLLNIKDGKDHDTNRIRYFSDEGCAILITRGLSVERVKGESKNTNMGVFKIEVFDISKRRFGVIADYHLTDEIINESYPEKFINYLANIDETPEFIAVCGDLVNDSTKMQQDIKFANDFIIPFEDKNIMIAEGFGNHDLWTGIGGTDMPRFIEGRNIEREKEKDTENKLNEFSYDKNSPFPQRHYTWTTELHKNEIKVKIHFFMLNNSPGYGGELIDNKQTDDSQKKQYSSYCSLNYLEESLNINYKDDYKHVAILFFHLFPDEETLGEKNIKSYDEITQKSKMKVFSTFFGHKHEHKTLYKNTSIKGFKCTACAKDKDTEGSEYANGITFVDMELKENAILEMTVGYLDDIEKNEYVISKSLSIDLYS